MKRVKGTHSQTPSPLKLQVALKTEIETKGAIDLKLLPFPCCHYKAAFLTASCPLAFLLGPGHCCAQWSPHSLTHRLPEAQSPPPHQPSSISLLCPEALLSFLWSPDWKSCYVSLECHTLDILHVQPFLSSMWSVSYCLQFSPAWSCPVQHWQPSQHPREGPDPSSARKAPTTCLVTHFQTTPGAFWGLLMMPLE